jgi:hypothetical protein
MDFVWRVRPGTGRAQWEVVKTALGVYKKEHGNLLVKQSFVVPRSDLWPQETWGTKLGLAVNGIRNHDQFLKSGSESEPERRGWLVSMDFVWKVSEEAGKPHLDWGIVKTALTVHKKEHGNLLVKQRFVVPQSDPWPQKTWGMKLGLAVNGIRVRNHQFLEGDPERRAWLVSMGFAWQVRTRRSAVQVSEEEGIS